MPHAQPLLSLAHSGDPDDAFMWWPITGKVNPDGTPRAGDDAAPRIDTGPFRYRAVPGDISAFNRLAAADAPHDITALSVRAYADAAPKYLITSCGSSFGEGYGPKVVARPGGPIGSAADLRREDVRIAIPGRLTSAFLALGLYLGPRAQASSPRFVEMPFDQVVLAVAGGKVEAGLVIHEAQVTFHEAGLHEVLDLGAWWARTRHMPLPLGVNAVRRDLDARFGPGSLERVAATLRESLACAEAHRHESLVYTMAFAEANARAAGSPPPTLATVDRYVSMYVTALTVDMGDAGRDAIRRLLSEGAAAGLCPGVDSIEVI